MGDVLVVKSGIATRPAPPGHACMSEPIRRSEWCKGAGRISASPHDCHFGTWVRSSCFAMRRRIGVGFVRRVFQWARSLALGSFVVFFDRDSPGGRPGFSCFSLEPAWRLGSFVVFFCVTRCRCRWVRSSCFSQDDVMVVGFVRRIRRRSGDLQCHRVPSSGDPRLRRSLTCDLHRRHDPTVKATDIDPA